MSTTVAATTAVTTVTSARPSPTAGQCGNLYDTPVRDAVCAMPYSEEHISYMESCCKGAEIYSYYDDCGLYCAAEDQTIGDLTKCLFDEGADYAAVFCRGNETASATGDAEPISSATASAIANNGSDDNDNDDNNDSNDDNNDNNDDNSNDDDDGENGATGMVAHGGVTVFGVVIGAMLLSGGIFGI